MLRIALAAAVIAVVTAANAAGAGTPAIAARIAVPAGSQPCAAAAGGGSVWVSLFSSPTLLRIDPETNRVTGRTRIGNGACGLGYGAGSLWVEDTYDSTISRVSAATGKRVAK